MNLIFYISVAKGLKRKIRKVRELVPAFVEVTGGKLLGGPLFAHPSPPPAILNRVKVTNLHGY